ncbi:SPASM domain-containing protein [Methanosarcina sp. MSH10X1]|uniref:radical SAM/SPASM domain-containing protein n=1 Tax=Methanosarcina sp. MSH10X1 TaxID=2507075 RepID=UPI000FFCA798|nr:radical SAM protein [Methanosarcina sp. MSH10X1]RXA19886.1 SPASM domain-containing protein [Methanosarcina sp. MSH10X1]
MKPSVYNFVWSTDDPEKAIVFNSLTTALAEVRKSRTGLLNVSQFDYALLPENEKQFVDELQKGGFVVEDAADELKTVKFAYNSDKYDSSLTRLIIAPTLACNFACSYCFEQSEKNQSRKSEQNAFMPDSVKQDLLSYVEKIVKTGKDIFVTWYGGEPLLAKDIIFDLSQKIIALTEENSVEYSAGMVTNGYLLSENPDIVQNLKGSRIKFIHVTLDGPREVHDSRRMLKGSNGPTFDRILDGVRLLKTNGIETYIRVNIDRSNIENISRLLDVLKENNLSDVFIYLGHVIPYTAGCKSYESSCMLTEEFSAINQEFYKNLNLMGFQAGRKSYYPRFARACDANRTNAFVLDPDGDMYKCWTEIGNKTSSIGKIGDLVRQDNEKVNREIQWLTWEPFEYSDCLKCKMLPICMGGCAHQAMFINSGRPECKEWKYGLENYVRNMFSSLKNLRADSK